MSIILPYDEEPDIVARNICPEKFHSENLSALTPYDEVFEAFSEEDIIKSATQSGTIKRKIEKGESYIPIPEQVCPLNTYKRKCDQYFSPPLGLVSLTIDEHKKKFDANGYGIDEVNLYFLFEALSGPPFVDITRLILDNNPFGKNPCAALATYLDDAGVKFLSLNGCLIGADGIAVLSDSIQSATTLEYLNLSRCDLRDDGGVTIAKAMAGNRSVINLDLSFNKMYTAAAKEIGAMMAVNTKLQVLNLKWNEFYPEESSKQIAQGLAANISIRNLNFSWNGLIGPKFAKEFASYLKKTRFLRILNMENNCLSDEELAILILGFQRCLPLKECYMGGNRWTNKSMAFFLVGVYPSLDVFSFGTRGLESNLYDLAQIFMMKPNKQIIFGGKIKPNPPDPVVFNDIIFDRMKLVAMKPKKKKFQRDMGHFMYLLLEQGEDLIKELDYDSLYDEFNAKLDPQLAKHLKELYLIKVGKVKRIDVKSMAEQYLKRHPTEKPVPKKKVEPPPPPPPPPPPEVKGKKKE